MLTMSVSYADDESGAIQGRLSYSRKDSAPVDKQDGRLHWRTALRRVAAVAEMRTEDDVNEGVSKMRVRKPHPL